MYIFIYVPTCLHVIALAPFVFVKYVSIISV